MDDVFDCPGHAMHAGISLNVQIKFGTMISVDFILLCIWYALDHSVRRIQSDTAVAVTVCKHAVRI